ncbi:MAG: DUF2974 domain-containing protein [Alphaproteobacteria bacterium]|nr:DUF2974 domain-containing protein [Alphaproteobacteria bacterium]
MRKILVKIYISVAFLILVAISCYGYSFISDYLDYLKADKSYIEKQDFDYAGTLNLKEIETNIADIKHLLRMKENENSDFIIALAKFQKSLSKKKVHHRLLKDDHFSKEFVHDILGVVINSYFTNPVVNEEKFTLVSEESLPNGFSAIALKGVKDELVIAYRGADETIDVEDMSSILIRKLPSQFYSAKSFYDNVLKEYPSKKIYVVGHSYGGTLAQLVSATDKNAIAITCNAVGAYKTITKYPYMFDYKNAYNIVVRHDDFSYRAEHPGYVKLISPKNSRSGNKLHPHSLANCLLEYK